ncbi:hypothetical protein MG293_002093 [Ovis ammon polii]|uniref:Uncharacterized protein n=1 Tax=Ovis ammon polii TaxID=230172 RepID=A0AAD4YIN8_OVIAM|nr:hypothetical protein MG293_002093 [Ovis ammon polii]
MQSCRHLDFSLLKPFLASDLRNGDLNPGIKPGSSALQADSLPSEPPGQPPDSYIEALIPGVVVFGGVAFGRMRIALLALPHSPSCLNHQILHRYLKVDSEPCQRVCIPKSDLSPNLLPLVSQYSKVMAPHSSPLAWKTPWAEEPAKQLLPKPPVTYLPNPVMYPSPYLTRSPGSKGQSENGTIIPLIAQAKSFCKSSHQEVLLIPTDAYTCLFLAISSAVMPL